MHTPGWDHLVERLRQEIKVLRDALGEAEEYFDGRADAEQPHGCSMPIPNDEARLLVVVRDALEATR